MVELAVDGFGLVLPPVIDPLALDGNAGDWPRRGGDGYGAEVDLANVDCDLHAYRDDDVTVWCIEVEGQSELFGRRMIGPR